ncbi:MAG: hypothetical protein WAO35_16635 [Terriglobia bacterium]
MIRSRPLHPLHGFIAPLGVGVVAALVLLTTAPAPSAQNPARPNPGEVSSPAGAANDRAATTTPQQKGEPQKSNLDKTRADAAELSSIADQLRDELDKMNVNVFSLDVLEKTEKLEKLAKKIKEEGNGH